MGEKRFIVRSREGSAAWDLPCNEIVDTQTGRVLGHDAVEPEDATFDRDLNWVVTELNRVAEEKGG